jgi:hypothetical protein
MKPGLGARLLLSATVLPAAALADEVFLVGGGRIVGEVVEERGDAVVIEVGAGRVTLPASRVVRVTSSTSALSVYRDRASRLAPQDAAGWLALGLWARDNDLITLASDAFRRAIAADPGNEGAHLALGHVRLEGQWMTEADSYRARGFVQYEGEWMLPEQAQMLAAQRMAEVEARRAEREAAAGAAEAEAAARAAEAEAARAAAEAAAGYGGIPYPYVFGPGYTPYSPYGPYVNGGPRPGRGHGGARRGRDGHRGDVGVAPRNPRDNGSPRSTSRSEVRGVGNDRRP